ncbi:MAG TPA: phytanoyl-CoA dioxygenase family protein [Polyangiaceae bacterium]|nr:phytanoyl-CoA dioxygenase family protein [Polyangiaceae bacterium]
MRSVVQRSLSALRRLRAPDPSSFQQPWPLAPGALSRLTKDVLVGKCSAAGAARISQFAANGYAVFEGAIAPALIDALVADVRSIGEHPGCFVTTDHKNGRSRRMSGPDFDSYESIFDTYVNFESARRVCFHPVIVDFLTRIFDAPPVAIQQLLFQRSNQHELHQDTSVVCVEEPLLMVATWIALEDVVKGRGELTYFEGSHRIPHYRYSDGTKRFDPKVDDAERARRYLVEECSLAGCTKHDFIAKKGDVFVWAADLVHGSNPRTLPEHETRMSLVTHYCPDTTQPYWLRFHPGHAARVKYEDATYMSSYYELPTRGGVVPPTVKLGN